MNLLDFADCAVLEQAHGNPVIDGGMNLNAHLRDNPVSLRQFHHAPNFINIVGERLLPIDMFAELHGAHRDRRVHVVGRGDVDRIDILCFLVEQFAPVPVEARVGELFPRLLGAI